MRTRAKGVLLQGKCFVVRSGKTGPSTPARTVPVPNCTRLTTIPSSPADLVGVVRIMSPIPKPKSKLACFYW